MSEEIAEASAVDEELESMCAQLRGYHATYLAVVERARAAGAPPSSEVVARVEEAFDDLERQLREAPTHEVRANVVERAEELEQGRAYIQPVQELVVEATTVYADMHDWGVPRPVLDAIDKDLLTKIGDALLSLEERRAALNKLYAYYDAWSIHVSDYERWATRNAWALGALLFAAALACVIAIYKTEAICVLMFAGLSGALLSVLGKFPPMLGWGQWASYTPRMLGRITTGVVTTLAGAAMLALDVVRIGDTEFDAVLASQDRGQLLVLAGLGIAFGFSERLLVDFQAFVFRADADRKSVKQPDTIVTTRRVAT